MGAGSITGDADFAERAMKIRLIVLDCDGVLTDGSLLQVDDGQECKRFHVRDGFGIRSWQRVGHQVAVITGRSSVALEGRCRELDIRPLIQGARDKAPALKAVLNETGASLDETCMIGDDLPDLPLILACGLGVAVADAEPVVRERADWVTTRSGGRGAIRETIERILSHQGRWQEVVDHYSRPIVLDE